MGQWLPGSGDNGRGGKKKWKQVTMSTCHKENIDKKKGKAITPVSSLDLKFIYIDLKYLSTM